MTDRMKIRCMLYIPVAQLAAAKDALGRYKLIRQAKEQALSTPAWKADEAVDVKTPAFYCMKLTLNRRQFKKLREIAPDRLIEIEDAFNVRNGQLVKVRRRRKPSAYQFAPAEEIA